MRFSNATYWHRPVTSFTLCALVVTSIGCTTTKQVHLSTSVPPAPEAENVEVVAVETVEGRRIEFAPAAAVVEQADGHAVLQFPEATTFDGREARLDRTLDLSEIGSYELIETQNKFSVGKTLGLLAMLAGFAFGALALMMCSGDGFYAQNC